MTFKGIVLSVLIGLVFLQPVHAKDKKSKKRELYKLIAGSSLAAGGGALAVQGARDRFPIKIKTKGCQARGDIHFRC